MRPRRAWAPPPVQLEIYWPPGPEVAADLMRIARAYRTLAGRRRELSLRYGSGGPVAPGSTYVGSLDGQTAEAAAAERWHALADLVGRVGAGAPLEGAIAEVRKKYAAWKTRDGAALVTPAVEAEARVLRARLRG